ncbi:MAG: protein kinase [Gemmatales bacterium]|nr:protein kinase [Gemmatales bacterium]MDW7995242.1 protein kinase [Gemmatales bacterium]
MTQQAVATRGFSVVVDELRQRYGWKLNEELGRGGFAIVYREEVDGIPRAVKISLDSLQSDHPAVQRQLEALQLLLTIGNHPQLLTLIRYEIVLGHLVTVWELADQGTLWDLLQAYQQAGMSSLPVDELLSYMEQAAEGIDFLNVRGIYHRDVKPHNLFLVGGQVKVGDLGLLKLAGASTASHTGAGTHGYLPPEAYGSADQPGQLHRSIDVYGLAATYVHLRTGKPPFGTNPSEIHQRQSRGEPIAEGLTLAEFDWLRRALSPQPEHRPLSAGAFVSELIARVAGVATAVPVVLPEEESPEAKVVPWTPVHEPSTESRQESDLPPLPRELAELQREFSCLEEAIQQAKKGTHPELLAATEQLRAAQNRADELRAQVERAPLPVGVVPRIRDIIWQRLLHNPDQPPSAFLALLPGQTLSWEFLQWLAQMKQAAVASRPLNQAERSLRTLKNRLIGRLRLQQAELWDRLDHLQRQDMARILRHYRRRLNLQARALPVELWVELGPKLQQRYLGYDLPALLARAEAAWEGKYAPSWPKRAWFSLGFLATVFGAWFGMISASPLGPAIHWFGAAFAGGALGLATVGLVAALRRAHVEAEPSSSFKSGPPVMRHRHGRRVLN